MSVWLSERYQHPNNQPHTGSYMKFDCSSLQLEVLSYEKQHSVSNINTNNQPIWSSTVQASSNRHYLICCYEKQQDIDMPLANLENFVLGKKLLDENENQKMKQKIQIQVT